MSKKEILVKLPSMRTSDDVVKRIQHDEYVDKNYVTVGYLDRFLGVLEKKFTSFVWCKIEMASIYDLAIPKHRIEYFKYHGEVVWSKKERLDKVFGSSNSNNETIIEVVNRHAPLIEKEKKLALLNNNNLDDGGGEEEGEGESNRNSKNNNSRNAQPRPTHFFCIPFSTNQIKMNIKSVQDEICSNALRQGMNEPELRSSGCILLSALHISLVMVYCPTPESIIVAKEVFNGCLDLLNTYLPRHLLLTLQGVDTFDERVVYSPPVEVGRLTGFTTELKKRLKAAGVRLVGNHEPYTPHMTITKLN